jgi:hypothetical protein
MWKETVLVQFEALSWHLHGENKKKLFDGPTEWPQIGSFSHLSHFTW